MTVIFAAWAHHNLEAKYPETQTYCCGRISNMQLFAVVWNAKVASATCSCFMYCGRISDLQFWDVVVVFATGSKNTAAVDAFGFKYCGRLSNLQFWNAVVAFATDSKNNKGTGD